jgi:hypothetical protein
MTKQITFILGVFIGIFITWVVILGILIYKASNEPDGTTVSVGYSLTITPKDSK